ncbi:hypothetical protein PGB90_008354 [Kerria lacca]
MRSMRCDATRSRLGICFNSSNPKMILNRIEDVNKFAAKEIEEEFVEMKTVYRRKHFKPTTTTFKPIIRTTASTTTKKPIKTTKRITTTRPTTTTIRTTTPKPTTTTPKPITTTTPSTTTTEEINHM